MRVYRRGKELLVAACDSSLIGKKLEEGKICLEITSFYDGDVVSREELLENLRMATMANLVGEETVRTAIEGGFVDEECLLVIGGVPHAQMVVI